MRRSDLERAVELYRTALDKARDCCGCGEGATEECAADILSGRTEGWPDSTLAKARELLAR